jgi:hypothetical protein
MVMITMTYATSSMTEDAPQPDHRPPIGVLQHGLPHHLGGARSTLWHQGPGRSPGLTSSSPGRSTHMMARVTSKNSFRSTTQSLRLLGEMIEKKPIIYPWHCPARPDHGSSTCPNELYTTGTNYVPCSSGTSRAHTSIPQLLRP